MKIGEVAQVTNLNTKTIRFYEDSGVLPPAERTVGGHREYGPEVLDRLRFVRSCQAAGLSLREVRQLLSIHDGGEPLCSHVQMVLEERLTRVRAQIEEMATLEARLMELTRHAKRGPSPSSSHDEASICWILETEPAR